MAGAVMAQSPVNLMIDMNAPGKPISPAFAGFSFETGSLHYGHYYRTNAYFFDSSNTRLLTLFHNLGIKSLRIGGNTVDRGFVPSRDEIDALFRFVKAADLKVVYSLRLANGDPSPDADAAKYLWDTYQPYLVALAVGNEPNSYEGLDRQMTNEAMFLAKWNTFAAAVTNTVPAVKLGGPDNGNGATAWVSAFARAEKGRPNVAAIFSHYEPGGRSRGKTMDQIIKEMLSPDFNAKRYPDCYAKIATTALSAGMFYQFTEANSHVAAPGSHGVNHSFATALFSLDFLHWWAAHGCRGIDFHTGFGGFNSGMFTTPDGGYGIYPLYYGIAAFSLGGQGDADAMTVKNPDGLNLTAYAVAADNNNELFVTIINKEHGPAARDAIVTLNARGKSAGVIYLKQAGNDVTATNGVTLGGDIIDSHPWQAKWTPIKTSNQTGCVVNVGAASAAIVKLSDATILSN